MKWVKSSSIYLNKICKKFATSYAIFLQLFQVLSRSHQSSARISNSSRNLHRVASQGVPEVLHLPRQERVPRRRHLPTSRAGARVSAGTQQTQELRPRSNSGLKSQNASLSRKSKGKTRINFSILFTFLKIIFCFSHLMPDVYKKT